MATKILQCETCKTFCLNAESLEKHYKSNPKHRKCSSSSSTEKIHKEEKKEKVFKLQDLRKQLNIPEPTLETKPKNINKDIKKEKFQASKHSEIKKEKHDSIKKEKYDSSKAKNIKQEDPKSSSAKPKPEKDKVSENETEKKLKNTPSESKSSNSKSSNKESNLKPKKSESTSSKLQDKIDDKSSVKTQNDNNKLKCIKLEEVKITEKKGDKLEESKTSSSASSEKSQELKTVQETSGQSKSSQQKLPHDNNKVLAKEKDSQLPKQLPSKTHKMDNESNIKKEKKENEGLVSKEKNVSEKTSSLEKTPSTKTSNTLEQNEVEMKVESDLKPKLPKVNPNTETKKSSTETSSQSVTPALMKGNELGGKESTSEVLSDLQEGNETFDALELEEEELEVLDDLVVLDDDGFELVSSEDGLEYVSSGDEIGCVENDLEFVSSEEESYFGKNETLNHASKTNKVYSHKAGLSKSVCDRKSKEDHEHKKSSSKMVDNSLKSSGKDIKEKKPNEALKMQKQPEGEKTLRATELKNRDSKPVESTSSSKQSKSDSKESAVQKTINASKSTKSEEKLDSIMNDNEEVEGADKMFLMMLGSGEWEVKDELLEDEEAEEEAEDLGSIPEKSDSHLMEINDENTDESPLKKESSLTDGVSPDDEGPRDCEELNDSAVDDSITEALNEVAECLENDGILTKEEMVQGIEVSDFEISSDGEVFSEASPKLSLVKISDLNNSSDLKNKLSSCFPELGNKLLKSEPLISVERLDFDTITSWTKDKALLDEYKKLLNVDKKTVFVNNSDKTSQINKRTNKVSMKENIAVLDDKDTLTSPSKELTNECSSNIKEETVSEDTRNQDNILKMIQDTSISSVTADALDKEINSPVLKTTKSSDTKEISKTELKVKQKCNDKEDINEKIVKKRKNPLVETPSAENTVQKLSNYKIPKLSKKTPNENEKQPMPKDSMKKNEKPLEPVQKNESSCKGTKRTCSTQKPSETKKSTGKAADVSLKKKLNNPDKLTSKQSVQALAIQKKKKELKIKKKSKELSEKEARIAKTKHSNVEPRLKHKSHGKDERTKDHSRSPHSRSYSHSLYSRSTYSRSRSRSPRSRYSRIRSRESPNRRRYINKLDYYPYRERKNRSSKESPSYTRHRHDSSSSYDSFRKTRLRSDSSDGSFIENPYFPEAKKYLRQLNERDKQYHRQFSSQDTLKSSGICARNEIIGDYVNYEDNLHSSHVINNDSIHNISNEPEHLKLWHNASEYGINEERKYCIGDSVDREKNSLNSAKENIMRKLSKISPDMFSVMFGRDTGRENIEETDCLMSRNVSDTQKIIYHQKHSPDNSKQNFSFSSENSEYMRQENSFSVENRSMQIDNEKFQGHEKHIPKRLSPDITDGSASKFQSQSQNSFFKENPRIFSSERGLNTNIGIAFESLDDRVKSQIAHELAAVLTVTGHAEVNEQLLNRLVQQAIISNTENSLSKMNNVREQVLNQQIDNSFQQKENTRKFDVTDDLRNLPSQSQHNFNFAAANFSVNSQLLQSDNWDALNRVKKHSDSKQMVSGLGMEKFKPLGGHCSNDEVSKINESKLGIESLGWPGDDSLFYRRNSPANSRNENNNRLQDIDDRTTSSFKNDSGKSTQSMFVRSMMPSPNRQMREGSNYRSIDNIEKLGTRREPTIKISSYQSLNFPENDYQSHLTNALGYQEKKSVDTIEVWKKTVCGSSSFDSPFQRPSLDSGEMFTSFNRRPEDVSLQSFVSPTAFEEQHGVQALFDKQNISYKDELFEERNKVHLQGSSNEFSFNPESQNNMGFWQHQQHHSKQESCSNNIHSLGNWSGNPPFDHSANVWK